MATYYWSGTGTWDNSSADNWYLATGGTGGNAPNAPLSTDTAILDSASGAGTCTVASTAVCAIVTLTGYTGTLAFGVNGKITVTVPSSTTVVTGATTFSVTGTNPLIEVIGGAYNVTITMGAMTEANSISVTLLSGDGSKAFTGSFRNLIFISGCSGNLGTGTRTYYGNLTLASGMGLGGGSNVNTFAATSGTQTITSNGVSFQQAITINAPGATVELGDALAQTSTRAFVFIAGTFTTNNHNWTVGNFSSTGSTTRALNLGSSLVTVLSGSTSAWNCNGATNITVNAGTSTIFFSGTGTKSFYPGTSQTYYNIKNAGGAGNLSILTSCTFNAWQADTLPCTFEIQTSTTMTVSEFPPNGSSATEMFCLISASPGTQFTLSKASGTWGATNVYVRDVNFTGGATWTATNSADGGNNTGATILYTGAARYWVGGSGTWDTSSTANWSTDGVTPGASAPGPGDYAYFSGTTGTVTLGENVTVSKWEVIGTPTFTFDFAGYKIITDWLGECFKTATGMTVTGGLSSGARVDLAYVGAGSVGPDAMRHGTSNGVVLEANLMSVYVTAGTATTGLPARIRTFDGTGFTGVLQGTQLRSVFGSWIMHSGMTDTGGSLATTFAGTSGVQEIYCGGSTFNCSLTLNGVGGTVRFMDAFSVSMGRTVSFNAGNLDANGFNVTIGTFSSGGSSPRTLLMGSGTWTITGSGTSVWALTGALNLTLTPSTSTILLTSASAKTFGGGGFTYYKISQGGAGVLTITGSNTFNDIQNAYGSTGATTITLTNSITQTVSNFTAEGTAGNVLILNKTSGGTAAILSKASGNVSVNYLTISDITATGGASWLAAASTDGGGNTGWVFAEALAATLSGSARATGAAFALFKPVAGLMGSARVTGAATALFKPVAGLRGSARVVAPATRTRPVASATIGVGRSSAAATMTFAAAVALRGSARVMAGLGKLLPVASALRAAAKVIATLLITNPFATSKSKYDPTVARVLTMIKRKGARATFTRDGYMDDADPVTQSRSGTRPPGSYDRWAVATPPGNTWREVVGTGIGKKYLELHVAPEGLTPEAEDFILWGGENWRVVDWVTYAPDGLVPIYTRILVTK